MTKRPDDAKGENETVEALQAVWRRMDETFAAETPALPDWTAFVRERRRIAKRKLWKELAILWGVAIPLVGIMMLLVTGNQTLFLILQAAAIVGCVPWLVSEFRKAGRAGGRRNVS